MRLREFAAYVAAQHLKLYPEDKALDPINIDAVQRIVTVDFIKKSFDELTTFRGVKLTVNDKCALGRNLFEDYSPKKTTKLDSPTELKVDSPTGLKIEFFTHLVDLFSIIAAQKPREEPKSTQPSSNSNSRFFANPCRFASPYDTPPPPFGHHDDSHDDPSNGL